MLRTIIASTVVLACGGLVWLLTVKGLLTPTATLGDALEPMAAVIIAVSVWWATDQLTDRRKFIIDLMCNELSFICQRIDEVDSFLEQAAQRPLAQAECEQIVRALKRTSNRTALVDNQLKELRFAEGAKTAINALANQISKLDVLVTGDNNFPSDNYSIKPVKLNACMTECNAVRLAVTSLEAVLIK